MKLHLAITTNHMSLYQDSPSCFTLFGRLAVQQGGNTRPLVLPIFHHRCLEDLILEKNGQIRKVTFNIY